jgi:very-short-patch-repair endonuclease
MGDVIVGSQSVLAGTITRASLRWNFRAIFPDVYVPKDVEPTLAVRTRGAWLWSRRRGVITGRAAAALHGARWVDDATAIELLWANNHCPDGIVTRRERIAPGEITWIDGMPVATPARTGLDLGRYLPRNIAVAHLDALASATGVTAEEILDLTYRYKGRHGVRLCREAAELVDAGAQSPQETRLRLLLIDRGFPPPQTQIPVIDQYGFEFAYVDMGWKDLRIAVEYDGDHHRTDTDQYRWDARRLRKLADAGWIVIRVMAGDRNDEVIAWVKQAWARRQREAMAVKRPA